MAASVRADTPLTVVWLRPLPAGWVRSKLTDEAGKRIRRTPPVASVTTPEAHALPKVMDPPGKSSKLLDEMQPTPPTPMEMEVLGTRWPAGSTTVTRRITAGRVRSCTRSASSVIVGPDTEKEPGMIAAPTPPGQTGETKLPPFTRSA